MQVPKRLSDVVNDIKSKHVKLKVTATELTDHITQRVHDWESFNQTMESLLDWLNGTRAELNDICRYYMFLSFFQDALDRHRVSILVYYYIVYCILIHMTVSVIGVTSCCSCNIIATVYMYMYCTCIWCCCCCCCY